MSGGISVLIVTWNSEDYIGACLQSLMMNVARPLEIIVVDNCSSDKTTEIVSGFSNAQLIETGANLGFAPAMNIAMQCASNPFVCLLNPALADHECCSAYCGDARRRLA